ncbi:hypothetical protein JCM11251_004795 [Rhodosporidiobolus azoricus]
MRLCCLQIHVAFLPPTHSFWLSGSRAIHQPASLLTLPQETLVHICEGLKGRSTNGKPLSALKNPVCKALLPAACSALYSYVYLNSFDDILLFARTVREHPGLGAEVRILYVSVEWSFAGSIEQPVKLEQEAPDTLSARLVRNMLSRLVNLEQLIVTGVSVIAQAALEMGKAGHFEQLFNLNLHSTFECWEPFNPSHFARLHHFPSLRIVSVNWDVTSVSLSGPLPLTAALTHVLQAFPSLLQLNLEDTIDAPTQTWAATFLSHVPNPSLLEDFSFHRHDYGYWNDPRVLRDGTGSYTRGNDITAFIAKCTSLTSLSLGGLGLAPLTHKFYSAIAPLPLETLQFSLHMRGVATTHLSHVIQQKKPAVKHLLLDHIKNDKVEGVYPEWTWDFTPDSLKELIELAKEERVGLDGDCMWAVHRESEHEPIAQLLAMLPTYKEQYRDCALIRERRANDGT